MRVLPSDHGLLLKSMLLLIRHKLSVRVKFHRYGRASIARLATTEPIPDPLTFACLYGTM
jgi:hypothetical protein